MKSKIALFGLLSLVSSMLGCSTPECRIDDFNGNCCIDESYCGNAYDNVSNSNSKEVNEACNKLGKYYKPILCPDDFNTSVLESYKNCTKLEVKRMCKGGDDLWNGAKANIFDVYCCE
jgi:hypothetical protein